MWKTRFSLVALAAFVTLSVARAQPILPALVQAPSVDAAMQVVGAGQPLPSGHLLLEFDDIVTPGPLRVRVQSFLPGTVAMVLLSGAPARYFSASTLPRAPNVQPSVASPNSAQKTDGHSELKPGYIMAWQVAAGATPQYEHRIPKVSRGQAFTLLVQAQGRWYIVVRELKIARQAGFK